MKSKIDISEQELLNVFPNLLDTLLIDRTTKQNIIWGTDNYKYLGYSYTPYFKITKELITGSRKNIIQPRVVKTKAQQDSRRKDKAEVFTPTWVCNEQINLIDDSWFGYPGAFNEKSVKSWKTNHNRILFPDNKTKSWQKYVDERRMELSCGEGPYLVSRYDTTTGKLIKLEERIGFLDRKMRIVCENTKSEEEWLKWAERAYQSIYGFEFQGDNLLLARENLLYSYVDYMFYKLKREPSESELLKIAKIISWNIWQMDGLTMEIPLSTYKTFYKQITFFDEQIEEDKNIDCLIKDWRSKRTIKYKNLLKEDVFNG